MQIHFKVKVHILPQNTEFHEVDESEEEPKSQGKTGQ
jgi:hypothetical protein